MGNGLTIKVTIEEGQSLFMVAAGHRFPEKLGETTFTKNERNGGNIALRRLYRDLTTYSPITQGNTKYTAFGPADCWEQGRGQSGDTDWFLVRSKGEVTIELSEKAIHGATWILIFLLHPESQFCASAGVQENILWPLVDKLKKRVAIEKFIGVDAATYKDFEDDPAPKEMAKETVKA